MIDENTSLKRDAMRPNRIKPTRILLLFILTPIIAPCYLLGIICALIHISAFCGYKNSEKYFMDGLGYETTEQTLDRLFKERFK